MERPTDQQIVNFLSEFRTRKEIMEKFNLSNTQSFLELQRLKKAERLDSMKKPVPGKKQRLFCYKVKS